MYFDRRLWDLTSGVRGRIALGVLVGVLAVSAGIARLALLGWLLAGILGGDPLEAIVPLALVVVIVMVARAALDHARAKIAHRTAALVQLRLRRRIHDHVTTLGPAYFGGARTGDVVLSMVEGVEQLETYFGQYLPQFFVAALTPPLIFLGIVWLDPVIATILLVAAVVTFLAPALWHRLDSRKSRERQKAYGAFGAEFLDSIQGLTTLKSFGQSRARAEALAERAHTLFRATMWVLGTNTLARGITDAGIAIGAATALGWGAYRVADGAMTLPVLLVVLMLGVEVFRPLRELRGLLHQGLVGMSAAEGIFALLAEKPHITDPDRPTAEARDLAPRIAFEDVRFGYPGARRRALDGLSFELREGERIGIVGSSGAGKSTIAKLLLRFYDPQGGCVRIGGHDLRSLRQADLRSRIAIVSQDSYLFHGTVEENLRLGLPDASASELEAAARSANAHGFIERLPHGYATVIGERGVRLSGGQRQRIAIARALLSDAPILILDEALSSVDAENESVIQEALDRLMTGRTTLVFAHRLSSVISADRILVLDGGRVVESGTHAALMRGAGLYHRLMAAQAQDQGAALFAAAPPGEEARAAAGAPMGAVVPSAPPEGIIRADGLGWPQLLRVLLDLVRPWRARLASTFTLGVARVMAFIGVGVLSALIVRAVRNGAPFDGLLIALGVLAPLAGVLHWMESWLAHDMAYRLLSTMRVDLFRKLDALAPAYFTRRRTGDLLGVATHDVEMVEYFFGHTIAPAFVAVLVPLAVLSILIAFGWPMALALLPLLAFAAFVPVVRRSRIDRLGAEAREALGELNAHAVDTVQGLAEIVAFRQAGPWGDAFIAKAKAAIDARLALFDDMSRQTASQELATGIGGLAVALIGAALVGQGVLDPGLLPMLTLIAMAAFLPVAEIAQVGRQLADTFGATRRLHAVQSEAPSVVDGPGVAPLALLSTAPALEMSALSFTYPGRHVRALDHVSIAVERGARVALVGPSGAGKSTIASLFLRFWDPSEGLVRMDGADLRDYALDDLRRRIALVAQDTYLFNDTLRNNILIARPEASQAELDQAVRQAALEAFVEELPDGLDTKVGERGAQLSGGQRQRVAIARAFLKQAPILILDEATSHLDAVNESAVLESLDRLMRGRTTVVIAHRLSTVRSADQILVLDHGRVTESGTHPALLARGGLYARLVRRQLSGGVDTAAQ